MPTPKPYVWRDGTRSWQVTFRLGGRGTRQTSRTFDTQREAASFCRDIDDLGVTRAVQRLDDNADREAATTVDQLAEDFLKWKASRVRSDRTIADYRRDYRLWIGPTFGHLPAAAVTSRMVQEWVDGMVDGTIKRKGT